MHVFGTLDSLTRNLLLGLQGQTAGLEVGRRGSARSSTPYPTSGDLERALIPIFANHGFDHHVAVLHPRTGERFEYDFYLKEPGVAVEIMGYRADDEVYKDILKFHVHEGTRVGVVWVPRHKWVSGKAGATNYRAALKALAFAESFMRVEALVAFAYDWGRASTDSWILTHVAPE